MGTTVEDQQVDGSGATEQKKLGIDVPFDPGYRRETVFETYRKVKRLKGEKGRIVWTCVCPGAPKKST